MDDYQKEIADLETQVAQLVESEADAKTIAELSMQLEILKAIYARATDVYQRGMKDEGLRCQRVLSASHENGICPASRISPSNRITVW